jgi:CRISPR type I-E-associated protein CasB/Cse2
MVCAIYAWHPHALIRENDSSPPSRRRSSFGQVCRAIAIEQEAKATGARPSAVDPQNNTFTARFERLVQCRKLDKMFVPMRAIVKLLASSGSETPIDFYQLLRDLHSWESSWSRENGARMKWMLDYWRADREFKTTEAQETEAT